MATPAPDIYMPGPQAAERAVRRSVLATFPNVDQARAALSALASRLTEPDKISLLGPGDYALTGEMPIVEGRDRAKRVSAGVLSGAVVGGVVGAVGGLIFGGLTAGVFNAHLTVPLLLALMVFGAVGLGAIGGFIGSEAPLESEGSSTGVESWPSYPAVAIECDSEHESDVAIRILRGRRPLQLYCDEGRVV